MPMQGKIIKGIAGFYYVYASDGRTYECKARGVFRNRKITLQLPEEVPDVIADRFLFSLLLKNILANSIKFTASREEAILCFRYCRKEGAG